MTSISEAAAAGETKPRSALLASSNVALRWLVAGGFVALALSGAISTDGRALLASCLLIGLYLCALTLHSLLMRPFAWLRGATLYFDAMAVTSVIVATGDIQSPAWGFYLIALVAAARFATSRDGHQRGLVLPELRLRRVRRTGHRPRRGMGLRRGRARSDRPDGALRQQRDGCGRAPARCRRQRCDDRRTHRAAEPAQLPCDLRRQHGRGDRQADADGPDVDRRRQLQAAKRTLRTPRRRRETARHRAPARVQSPPR